MNEQSEKELMLVEYIKSIKALEDAMEPYKDQRRELRKEYQDNGWLSREEIRVAVKAYRLMRSGDDLYDLYDMYSLLSKARAGLSIAECDQTLSPRQGGIRLTPDLMSTIAQRAKNIRIDVWIQVLALFYQPVFDLVCLMGTCLKSKIDQVWLQSEAWSLVHA